MHDWFAACASGGGEIGPEQLRERPRLRSRDLVEYVPGMVATQHSRSGKANQYLLRGFNLDRGTDFATFVDGMPGWSRTPCSICTAMRIQDCVRAFAVRSQAGST